MNNQNKLFQMPIFQSINKNLTNVKNAIISIILFAETMDLLIRTNVNAFAKEIAKFWKKEFVKIVLNAKKI